MEPCEKITGERHFILVTTHFQFASVYLPYSLAYLYFFRDYSITIVSRILHAIKGICKLCCPPLSFFVPDLLDPLVWEFLYKHGIWLYSWSVCFSSILFVNSILWYLLNLVLLGADCCASMGWEQQTVGRNVNCFRFYFDFASGNASRLTVHQNE